MKNGILYFVIICMIMVNSVLHNLYAEVMIELERVVDGIDSPVQITNAGDGSNRLFIVEQQGRILVLDGDELLPEAFLDIRSIVSSGGEKGLLSVAFHPDFKENQRFFVNYTKSDRGLKTVIAEYGVSVEDANVAELDERVVLEIDQPFSNHNGGQLQFGPDGFLYIGMGDGGSGGDPSGNGQNINTLLGSLLRIDVDNGMPFSVPSDNPFVGIDGADEIWAYGLRNPWRFSFDSSDGRLFLADVGQNSFEEVDLIEKGGNYGWNIMEGLHCFSSDISGCNEEGLILPVTEYSHDEGNSITGGYVYRGQDIEELVGSYIFADYVSSTIWALNEVGENIWERKEILESGILISSFGEDEGGELYIVDHEGAIFKMLSAEPGDGDDDEDDDGDEKSFKLKCDRDLIDAKVGLEKVVLIPGDELNCVLELTSMESGVNIEVTTRHRRGFATAVKITPSNGVTDEKGKLEFQINAINKGVDWISWAVLNNDGQFSFNKEAYNDGFAWGMFVEVR